MIAPSRAARGGRGKPREGSLPQAVAVLTGVVFVLIGALGFLATGFDDFAAHAPDKRLFGLALNPLQNVVHLLVGVLGLVLSARLAFARCCGWLLAASLGALFVFGLAVADQPQLNVFNVNWADNWLHLVAALGGLVAALGPARVGRPWRRLHRSSASRSAPAPPSQSSPPPSPSPPP